MTYLTRLSFLFSLYFVLLIVGCSRPGDVKEEEVPTYSIETQTLSSFSREASFEKNATITSSQNIVVTAQSRGTINRIRADVGDTVGRGRVVVQLSDSLDNIWLQVERANLAVQTARLNLATTQASLDKSVSDAEIWVQQAQQSLQTTQKVTQQQIQQALQNLEDAQVTADNSSAALDIERLETQLKLQLRNLVTDFRTQQQNYLVLLEDTLYQSDQLLWVTDQYRLDNDSFEEFLGAKDVVLKVRLENQLRALYVLQKEYTDTTRAETTSSLTLQEQIDLTTAWYDAIIDFLVDLEALLKQSITSSTFSQSRIDGLIASISGLRTRARWERAGFIAYTQQANNALTSVDDEWVVLIEQQLAIARKAYQRQTENADVAYQTTLANAEEQITQAQLNLTRAQNTLEQALTNRKNQLDILENAVRDAQKSLNDAQRRFGQLAIKAPINGVIDDIFVDIGEDVGPGTRLFSIVADKKKQAEVFVSRDELDLLKVWAVAEISDGNTSYQGKIVSLGTVANSALQYKVTIESNKLNDINVWSVVTVKLPFTVNRRVVPLKYLTITQENRWYINLWRDETLVKEFVDIGKTRGDSIEILTPLPMSSRVVTSPLDNYDEINDILVVDGESYDLRPAPLTGDIIIDETTDTVPPLDTGNDDEHNTHDKKDKKENKENEENDEGEKRSNDNTDDHTQNDENKDENEDKKDDENNKESEGEHKENKTDKQDSAPQANNQETGDNTTTDDGEDENELAEVFEALGVDPETLE